MKKKLVMKKWVEYLLLVISFIAILIGTSECINITTFLITHGASIIILLFVAYMFICYGRDSD